MDNEQAVDEQAVDEPVVDEPVVGELAVDDPQGEIKVEPGVAAAAAPAFDVVVVGAGFAGLSAALRATEFGLKVALLERGEGPAWPCNSRWSGGIFHIAYDNPRLPSDKLRELVDASTGGLADPVLVEALVNNAGRTIQWLQNHGARFITLGRFGCVLAPPRPHTAGLVWEGRGPDVTLRDMGNRFTRAGGHLHTGTRALELIVEEGRVCGVRAECRGAPLELRARAVVLADGGFQADAEQLLDAGISAAPDRLKQRGAATGTGDALRMARAAGAATTALQGFYGHVLARGAMEDDRLWPYPELDHLAAAGIVVDGAGERVLDEGGRGVYIANAIAALPDPLDTHLVFDSLIWEHAGREARIPPNPQLELAGGLIHRADTLEELAQLAGLPAEQLQATVRAYNEAVAAGSTAALLPPRTTDLGEACPIHKGPYFGVPVCAGITFTMGGIRIDANGRVLGEEGEAISGLYAAGSCTGGVDGGPRRRYIGGLMRAAVFGLLAAEDIALAPQREAEAAAAAAAAAAKSKGRSRRKAKTEDAAVAATAELFEAAGSDRTDGENAADPASSAV